MIKVVEAQLHTTLPKAASLFYLCSTTLIKLIESILLSNRTSLNFNRNLFI